jgi:hypothetical protein
MTKLDVTVADATTAPDCSGTTNYKVDPAQSTFPIVVPPGSTSLSALIGTAALPRVSMLDLPVNQDACKGAHVRLELSGTAEQ